MTDHSALRRRRALTAIAAGIAFTVGAEAPAFAAGAEDLGSGSQLRAKILGTAQGVLQEDKGGEGRCGEGKCGTAKPASSPTSSPTPGHDDKSGEGKCGEGKCGGKK